MSGYDFTGFRSYPPPGMKVQKANKDYLWLSRTRAYLGREDFVLAKRESGLFAIFRLGGYDIKKDPVYWMNDAHIILESGNVVTLLRALGYKIGRNKPPEA